MAFSKAKTASNSLRSRIQKARDEGRTQQALELAKQLAKQQPTDEHRQLVRAVVFERGCELLHDGKQREAIVVFQNALALDAPPQYRAAVAGKLAQAGEVVAALKVFAQLPDCDERTKAFEHAVDAALMKGPGGRDVLPPDLHPAFDAVLRAFAHVEKSEDDAARDALQPIGLSSPMLEWKVMLRGLVAYHQKDDVRALDNWQRLSPERQPWRLVAPFRFRIDAAFRDLQPAPTRQRLQSILDRVGEAPLVLALRDLDKTLAHPWSDDKSASESFRKCQAFATTHGNAHPELARRAFNALYLKVLCDGSTRDAERFAKSSAGPADDPLGLRLGALVAERDDRTDEAIQLWMAHEAIVATMKDRFPPPEGNLARALVWERLGKLVGDALREFPNVPSEIPRPDECYRKSIALVPGRVRPHQLLLDALRADPTKEKQAVTAAKKLVAEFPDHAPTWEFLGDALVDDDPDGAIAAFRAALKGDPMRRDLRRKFADAVWAKGAAVATRRVTKKSAAPAPESYRPILEEAIRYTEGSLIARYAAWIVLETRLGHVDFAAELRAKAEGSPAARFALPLALHVAAQQDKKVAAELRDAAAARWHEALAQAPTPDEILAGLEALVHFPAKTIRGKKPLVESFVPKPTNAHLEAFDEEQVLKLGRRLCELKLIPMARRVAVHGTMRFPKNPRMLLLKCDVLTANDSIHSHWALESALKNARKLAVNLPREQQEAVVKEIERHEAKLLDLGGDVFAGFGRMVEQMMDGFGGEDDDYDDDDYDDDGW